MEDVIDDTTALRNIAINTRHFLQVKGMSQSDLARATGETRVFISNLVRGVYMPGAGALKRVADALDVSVDQLIAIPAEVYLAAS